MTLANLEKFLLFLVLLFLPTQLGKHFWPQFSYVYSLRIDYLSPTLYFWDLLLVVLLLLWIGTRPQINHLALNLWLFFILSQAVSLLGSDAATLGRGLVRLEQYVLAGLFGVYIASANFETIFSKLQLPLMTALLFESALALMQFIKGGTLGFWILGERSFSISTLAIAKFDFYGVEFLRPYATFPHPNVLAAFLLISLLLLAGKKVLIIKIIATVTIILTFSRTAILAGIFLAALLLRRKVLLFAAVVLLLISPLLFTRFSSIFNYDNLTILRREELVKSAIELFWKNPVYGVGLNNFVPSLSSDLIPGPNRFLQPVHNILLLSLAETGILGLLGLLGLIGYPIWKLLKLPTTHYQLRTLLLIWGIIIFLGMFDHYFLTLPQGYRLLFLIWGLSLAIFNSKSLVFGH